MTWLAAHQTPSGTLARFTAPSRATAAQSLYAMMVRSGVADAPLKQLAASANNTHFMANVDGHWFALSRREGTKELGARL